MTAPIDRPRAAAAESIEALPELQPGAAPRRHGGVRPEPVLQGQPRQLVLAGPEHILTFRHQNRIFGPTAGLHQP